MKADLNIRIISNLSATQSIMLFQKDIIINTGNYKIGAWKTAHIAPESEFSVILPSKEDYFTNLLTKLISLKLIKIIKLAKSR